MVRVNWTKLAAADLKNIAGFTTAKYSAGQSKSLINSIILKVKNLKALPESGIVVDGITDESIRQIDEIPYKILYKIVSPEQIHVLAIHENINTFNKRNVF